MNFEDCHTQSDIIERHIIESMRRSEGSKGFAKKKQLVTYVRTSNKENCNNSQLMVCGYAHAVFYPSAKNHSIVESRRSVSFSHLKQLLESLEDNTILLTRDFSRLGRFPLSDYKKLYDLYNEHALRGIKIHVLASQLSGNEHSTPLYDYDMISEPSKIKVIIAEQYKSFLAYATKENNKSENIKFHKNKKIDKRLKSMVKTWNNGISKGKKPIEIKKLIRRNTKLSMSSINKSLSSLKSKNLLN